jgi:membrane protease YdiL (CAAX protease family)
MLTRVSVRPIAGVGSFGSGRLIAWTVLVGALAVLNYATRFAGGQSGGGRTELYTWSGAVAGAVFYAIFFAFVYAIAAVDTDELFALRRPESWSRAAGLSIGVFVAIYVWSFIVSQLPLPQSPGKEQGLTPTHWEPQFAKQYAANFVVIAGVAPFVEELAFRGVGYRLLLERYGRWIAIVGVGVAFGLAHGLVEGLLVLIPFGVGLAYLRDRTDSTIPGMVVHFAFNSIALLAVLAS